MRILLLHSSSDLYGASKIFLQTVKIFLKRGHHCIVVLSSDGYLVEELKSLGVQVEIINLGILRKKYFSPTGLLNRISKWYRANFLLQKIIVEEKIDLVYSNTAAVLIGGWVVYFVNKKNLTLKKVQHIWHIHEIIEKPKFVQLILKWCMRYRANKILVVSKAVQKNWDRGILLYNGIEPMIPSTKINYREQFLIPKEAIVIGMAARIHYWKGQSYFLQIAKAMEKHPVYFIISGDPFPGYEYLLANMQDYINENDLSDRVKYIGFERDMDCFYQSIDILVLPSQQPDPLPTVVLEAMQYGLPVVATEQGGALEMIVEGETGIFIALNDVAAATKKITSILPETIRKQMGKQGQQRVETYFSAAAFEKNLIEAVET